MRTWIALAALAVAAPLAAEGEPVTPASVVAAAKADEWVAIDPADLLVMELAPDAQGQPRTVVIELLPPPISQGWVANIRTLAKAHWWDGTSVNRVQDNYVVQWGDATEKKPLPPGLEAMAESAYVAQFVPGMFKYRWGRAGRDLAVKPDLPTVSGVNAPRPPRFSDTYADDYAFVGPFPLALAMKLDPNRPYGSTATGSYLPGDVWPTHCYGMVGVGRDVAPDTGTGAELYTVIGQAPRQLDRNIALVGRIIEGMENLSSLPRGTGELGFYADDEADKRVPILSVRLGSELARPPRFEYLSADSDSFARYASARANRKDDFYIRPAGGVDICNLPVPVRRAKP